MKSKTQLFKDVRDILPDRFPDIHSFGLKAQHVGNETYGRDSHIYLICADMDQRRRLQSELRARGHKVNLKYWPENSWVDVQVSYFKGRHWDE